MTIKIPIVVSQAIHGFFTGQFFMKAFSQNQLPAAKMMYNTLIVPVTTVVCCICCRDIIMMFKQFLRCKSILWIISGGFIPIIFIIRAFHMYFVQNFAEKLNFETVRIFFSHFVYSFICLHLRNTF